MTTDCALWKQHLFHAWVSVFSIPQFSVQQCIIYCCHKDIFSENTMGCTPKESNLNPYMTRLSRGMPWRGMCAYSSVLELLSHEKSISPSYDVKQNQEFTMMLADGTPVWFSLVLAWGAMSWKAIRSIKRSTGMRVCSSLRRETKRKTRVARERGLDRLSQLLPDRVPPWNLAQDICPVKRCKFVSGCLCSLCLR